jgi:ketosteroid isomerase-like protein
VSEPLVSGLRVAFDQFARGDFAAFEVLPDDFELRLDPQMPDAGSYRGETARNWLTSWVDSFERMTYEAIEFVDRGDRVVVEVIQRGWSAGSEQPVELRHWAVATEADGRLRRLELFLDEAEALRA